MSSNSYQPALICPYTLMEEEALAWSLHLFSRAVLLHPFPLPLPPFCHPLVDLDLLQVRSLVRSREEIREKDKRLREMETYLANNPGRGFLRYLKEAALMEDQETQEEIIGLMRGRPLKGSSNDSSIVNGPILLCLIHEWMVQEWEVETSLAAIKEQEKNLVQSWQETPEEGSIWKSADPLVLKRNEAEINCPPALAAWWELKNALVPEPFTLFTTQQWVWAEHYGLDPEEDRISSIPLPDLGSLITTSFQNPDFNGVIRERMGEVLRPAMDFDPQRAVNDFQKALLELGLPPDGKYRLVFPPHPQTFPVPPSPLGKRGSDPLILLSPALI